MKWFFRFAIFWMHIRWTWCDLQWACHDSQNKNPNSMWILRQWGTKTQWRGGKAGGPPCCLPVCATRICSFFGRMLAIARVCVCKSVGRVCECERQSPCTLFSLPSQPSASALSLHLQSCCARSKRTEVCIVFLKGRGGGVGVVRMMTRWKGPGEEETQECPFPLSPFSFSLSLALASSLSLCDVVCVRVCCVCVRERESETGRLCFSRLDCEPAQEEAALSRLRYVTELSSHAFPQYLRHVGRFVIEWKTGCWRR